MLATFLLVIQAASAASQAVFASNSLHLGNGYNFVTSTDTVSVTENGKTIWGATVPFISASAGRDLITGSSGAFNITKVDEDVCQSQNIEKVGNVDYQDALNSNAVQLSGKLLDCGGDGLSYKVTFYVPKDLHGRVAFEVHVSPSTSGKKFEKVYLSFDSNAGEDFYGLGAQASFASLKNHSVPIFTREQGVGRGDQPVTGYENE
jgi:hypothetical protein